MKMILTALTLMASVSAFAQDPPALTLQPGQSGTFYDYNTRQDVQVRCGGGPDHPPGPAPLGLRVLISCDPYTNMIIELYSQDGTKTATYKTFLGSNDSCSREKTRINNAVGGRLIHPRTVAFCDPYTNVIKLKLDAAAITQSEKTFAGSDALCVSQSDDFNSIFGR